MNDSILIATMAGGPQVVTFALDALLPQDPHLKRVVVVHLTPKDDWLTQRAIRKLEAEFTSNLYAGQLCPLQFFPIHYHGQELEDIRDEAAAHAAWLEIYELIATLKAQGHRLHICIAGGRRLLALMAMSAATLLFDHYDRLWHMYTPPDFLARAKDGAILHAQPEDGVRLIQVPLAPWGAYFPGLRSLVQADPAQIIATQTQRLDREERERCEKVTRALTGRRLDVLRAFARGLNPQEAAEALSLSIKTVDGYKTDILSECRVAWGLPEGEYLSYHFLRQKFERYFASEA